MKAYLNDMDERKVDGYFFMIGDTKMYRKAGIGDITEMRYHASQGEGDKHFVDIYYENGEVMRVFSIESIVFRE